MSQRYCLVLAKAPFQKGVDLRWDQIWGCQMKQHLLAIDGDGARAGNQPQA